MSKLDEKKEYISTLRIYLGFILAVVLAIGTGLSKLYIAKDISILFFIAIGLILLAIFVFIKINTKLHQEIKSLRDL